MRTFQKLMVLSCLIAAAKTGFGSNYPQSIWAYYYWQKGATSVTSDSSESVITPYHQWVDSGTNASFTAHPGKGLKTVQWYYGTDVGLFYPSKFTKANSTDDTLQVAYGDYAKLSSTVYLAVEFDWINYALTYAGESDTETLCYTTSVTIAECSQTRTGYTFANAWTNTSGSAFDVATPVTGEDFAITNHNDEGVVTLYPVWTANTYDVTLDAQGGSGGTESLKATYDSVPDAIDPPARIGYTFNGYFTQPSGNGKRLFAADGTATGTWRETADQTLYADWSVNRYTVTVSVDGDGTVSVNPSPSGGTYTNGQSVVLTATPTSEKATTFIGWADGSTENPRTIVVTSAATYTARFETKAFTVTWEDDSLFDSETLKTDYVKYGEDSDPPDTPQHDGYKFKGWTQDGTNIRANTTITATYEANKYRVKMYRNDGSSEYKSLVYTYDAEGTLPLNEFIRTGYTFAGWGTNATDGVVVWQDCARVWNWSTGVSVSLYAVWRPITYAVHFEPGEGTGTMTDQDFVYDSAQALTANEFTNGELGFIHWLDSDGKKYTDGQTVSNLTATAQAVVTLTAVWEQTIHVAFDGNGATNADAMAVQDFASPEDEKPLSINRFGKVGYTFVGWATNRTEAVSGNFTYADGATVRFNARPGSTVTLYAAWRANTYFVAFDPGAGCAEKPLDAVSATYDTPFALPDMTDTFVSPDPDLYSFAGWRDTLNGATYTNCAVVSNLCAAANATNTLVATWQLDLGEWSERLHCTNLHWRVSYEVENQARWSREGTVSQSSGSAPTGESGEIVAAERLTTTVKTNGTLKFKCRWNTTNQFILEGTLGIGFVPNDSQLDFDATKQDQPATNVVLTTTNVWTDVELPVTVFASTGQSVIRIINYSTALNSGSSVPEAGATIEIDCVEWIPEGSAADKPEPTAGDSPTVTGISFVNGKFVITATGDARFGYRVLATDSLTAPIEWFPLAESYQEGSAEGQTFEISPALDEGQKFYRVEVLQKR